MPPRSFLAQKVIMRPRSAAASTCAKLPSSTDIGLRTDELQDYPGQLPITPPAGSSRAEELMRDVVRVEQIQEIRKAFVALDAEQVRRTTDASE